MKLKKIASLALAGLMAVSMLTACGGNGNANGGNNDGNKPVVTTAPVVDAVNDGQSVTNTVKINFTSDASLDAALLKAVNMYGDRASIAAQPGRDGNSVLRTAVLNLTGMKVDMPGQNYVNGGYTNQLGFFSKDMRVPKDAKNEIDGNEYTQLYVVKLQALTEDAALNQIAQAANLKVAELDATTKDDDIVVDEKYYDYSYTGTVSMVSVSESDGGTAYYAAGTITQTVAKKTWEK